MPAREIRLRDLATFERFRVQLHDHGYHYSISTLGYYSSSSSWESVKPCVYNALQYTIAQHAALGLQVRRENNGSFCFIRLEKVDLEQVVQFEEVGIKATKPGNSETLQYIEGVLSGESSTAFRNHDLPLWRVRVLSFPEQNRHAILFTWHHAIADGKSGQAMHYSILHGLNLGADHEEYSRVAYIPALTLLPSLDDLFTYPQSWSTWLSRSFKNLSPTKQLDPSMTWTGEPYQVKDGVSKTLIRLIELSHSTTSGILQATRKNKTSVTALLLTIVGMILFERIPEAQHMRCASAMEVRRFISKDVPIDYTKMGVWIDSFALDLHRAELLRSGSSIPPSTPQGNEEVAEHGMNWDAARKSKDLISRQIAKGVYDLGFRAFRGVRDFEPLMKEQLGKKRQNSYSIVNVGICNATKSSVENEQEGDGWRLERMVFAQSAHANGSAIQFCVVSTVEGGMSICANWQEGIVEELVDHVMQELEQRLEDVALRTREQMS